MIRFLWRFVAIWSAVTAFCAASAATLGLSRKNRHTALERQKRLVTFFSRLGLAILNVRPRVRGRFPPETPSGRGVLIVSNHLSYLDILMIASVYPVVFVTSTDLDNDFLLKALSFLGGSLFVERKKFSRLTREIREISEHLASGHRVCLFPETTSSDGTGVLPFRSALLDAARHAETPILPVCVRYRRVNGYPASPENLDLVCFYGRMRFAFHLVKLLWVGSVDAELDFLEPIETARFSRKQLGDRARDRISEIYFRAAG
jgi:1-acyl-sn-glycerol-3-phosphate acyltransferase